MMQQQPDSAGWLPDGVQAVANAAVRAGLVPLVQDGFDESISLRDEGDREIGIVAASGAGAILYIGDEDDCVTIAGEPRILAWITRTTGRYVGHAG
jgi:hypothetical protein